MNKTYKLTGKLPRKIKKKKEKKQEIEIRCNKREQQLIIYGTMCLQSHRKQYNQRMGEKVSIFSLTRESESGFGNIWGKNREIALV